MGKQRSALTFLRRSITLASLASLPDAGAIRAVIFDDVGNIADGPGAHQRRFVGSDQASDGGRADSGGTGDLRGGGVAAGPGTLCGGPAAGRDDQVAVLRTRSLDFGLQP